MSVPCIAGAIFHAVSDPGPETNGCTWLLELSILDPSFPHEAGRIVYKMIDNQVPSLASPPWSTAYKIADESLCVSSDCGQGVHHSRACKGLWRFQYGGCFRSNWHESFRKLRPIISFWQLCPTLPLDCFHYCICFQWWFLRKASDAKKWSQEIRTMRI